MGVKIEVNDGKIRVKGSLPPRAIQVKTLPYPGFPTDLQPQLTSLACLARGSSVITETIFENRFAHLPGLRKMGAQIEKKEKRMIIKGVPFLKGASVVAPDIRGGVALVLAGLAARGKTEVLGIHHIDRGYQKLEKKLAHLGAKIKRIKI
jgi:UDP-N-acetylglucosamine 1-carboxyvinyltransferase